MTLHYSPGGVSDAINSEAFGAFSAGRVMDATYAYANLTIDHLTPLPKGRSLRDTLIAQVAPDALPETEQIGVGGVSAVRVYTSEDGSYDLAVILRNEFHLPTITLGTIALTRFSPFAFADVGYGYNYNGTDVSIASFGAGADFVVGPTQVPTSPPVVRYSTP